MFFFQSPYLPELLISSRDFHSIERSFRARESGIRNVQNFTDDDLEAWKYVFAQPSQL
jgi:hypothetical protein